MVVFNNAPDPAWKVLESHSEVAPFLEDICRASDDNRNALGFFPRSVFQEFARREHLYVLVEQTKESSNYVGHLMFQKRFPRAHIVQMFIMPDRRRKGSATGLLNHLLESLTNEGFTSVYARVAEDLTVANAFWKRQHFYVQRTELGGAAKKRHILVRCHELSTPQLFPASGLKADNPLGISLSSPGTLPIYLIDLNVLYDIAPRRLRREEVLSLFQAERMNFCQLAVSSEVSEELRRTAHAGKTDPMEAYVSLFSSLPFKKGESSRGLIADLAKIVFPAKGKLRPNDESDLRHLATAVQHKVVGFITNDGAILEAANQLQEKFGLDVLSPAAFVLDTYAVASGASFSVPEDVRVTLQELTDTEEDIVREFLVQLSITAGEIARGWLPTGAQKRLAARYGIWSDSRLEGYITWSGWSGAGLTTIRAAIDERSPLSEYTARIVLTRIMEGLSEYGPRKLAIEFPPHHASLRELAFGIGFRGEVGSRSLVKVMLGRPVIANRWNAIRKDLATSCGIKLPERIPRYRANNQRIEILTPDGNRNHISLDELETLLTPALLILPGRPAVITPVQRRFADLLLECTPQKQLLPQSTLAIYQERHYLSGPKTLDRFNRGTLILFYESLKERGRGELIAIARTKAAYLKSELSPADFEPSILSPETIAAIGKAKTKTVAVFDNVFLLPKAVPLKKLKAFGCGGPNDLITTHSITDDQLQHILEEAFGDG